MIHAVIVEDEPLAREYLSLLLAATGLVSVDGMAGDARFGLELCTDFNPDVVFLDIRLPGMDGMGLARQIASLRPSPKIVFVTGTAEQAAEAFHVDAVDYLLKPLTQERVTCAVQRVADRLASRPGSTLADLSQERLPIKIRQEDRIKLLHRDEIVAAIRSDRRTWIHTRQEEFATYYPLAHLLRWFGDGSFLLLARDVIVNLHAVNEVIHYGDRLYQVRLCDRSGTVVDASRTGAARLANLLKTPF